MNKMLTQMQKNITDKSKLFLSKLFVNASYVTVLDYHYSPLKNESPAFRESPYIATVLWLLGDFPTEKKIEF